MSNERTPIRFVAIPRCTPRRDSLWVRKSSPSADASAGMSRTSPATTMPGASGMRATCVSLAEPPSFTTREAAIWEAPILRPTISCFRARLRSAPPAGLAPDSVFFLRRRTRSDSLISLFRSMCRLHLRRKPQAVLGRGLVRGDGGVDSRRRNQARDAGPLEQAAELVGPGRACEGRVGRDHVVAHEVGERLLHRLHPARSTGLHHRVDLL